MGESPRYVAQLEKRIEEKDAVIGLLRNELGHRNEEIVRRNERERETNILIRGLQNLVLQLQPGRARAADVLDDDPLMQKVSGTLIVRRPANRSAAPSSDAVVAFQGGIHPAGKPTAEHLDEMAKACRKTDIVRQRKYCSVKVPSSKFCTR